jgi:DNA-binding response OmpR family regulator
MNMKRDLRSASFRPDPASAPRDRHATRSRTVFVLGEEPLLRTLICASLRVAGYHVVEADSWEGAECYGGPIDLLLWDLNLPRESGPDLGELLADRPPGLCVLTVSDAAPPASGGAWLRKPFTVAELMDAVRGALAEPTAAEPSR